MKIFINDIFPGDPDVQYKFLIEDSYSEELKAISREMRNWELNKRVVVIITIDEKNKNIDPRLIIKMAREIVKSVKGIDYLDEIITTIKYNDLSEIKI